MKNEAKIRIIIIAKKRTTTKSVQLQRTALKETAYVSSVLEECEHQLATFVLFVLALLSITNNHWFLPAAAKLISNRKCEQRFFLFFLMTFFFEFSSYSILLIPCLVFYRFVLRRSHQTLHNSNFSALSCFRPASLSAKLLSPATCANFVTTKKALACLRTHIHTHIAKRKAKKKKKQLLFFFYSFTTSVEDALFFFSLLPHNQL